VPDLLVKPRPDRWPRAIVGFVLLVALAVIVGVVILVTRDNGGTTVTGENGDAECESVEAPSAREPETREEPSEPLEEGASTLVVETSCGPFTIALDPEQAPNTSASLVALAEDGFFDDTTFHRVVPGFVIQGGDPTGSGAGGPGYSTVDAPQSDAKYVRGVVAMAKTEVEPPGTAGSQFFVVTGEDIGLPPDYAIIGEVSEGFEAVERIEALGTGDGPPSQPVVIETITVEEG
jgi:peptidyl-prolyl cis-trans isomerase B (cyclophilin B)